MVSATEKATSGEQFNITLDEAPQTHRIYMQYPVEVTECWANILGGRKIDAGVKTSVGKILEETLFELIGGAFLADGVATKDVGLPSGLRPIRGELRSNSLTKLEKIEVAALKATYIAHLAGQHGIDNISGGYATCDVVPTSMALKVKEALTRAAGMMLSAGNIVGDDDDDDVCSVRMCTLIRIDNKEN